MPWFAHVAQPRPHFIPEQGSILRGSVVCSASGQARGLFIPARLFSTDICRRTFVQDRVVGGFCRSIGTGNRKWARAIDLLNEMVSHSPNTDVMDLAARDRPHCRHPSTFRGVIRHSPGITRSRTRRRVFGTAASGVPQSPEVVIGTPTPWVKLRIRPTLVLGRPPM